MRKLLRNFNTLVEDLISTNQFRDSKKFEESDNIRFIRKVNIVIEDDKESSNWSFKDHRTYFPIILNSFVTFLTFLQVEYQLHCFHFDNQYKIYTPMEIQVLVLIQAL